MHPAKLFLSDIGSFPFIGKLSLEASDLSCSGLLGNRVLHR